jgi:hypothetical protein
VRRRSTSAAIGLAGIESDVAIGLFMERHLAGKAGRIKDLVPQNRR